MSPNSDVFIEIGDQRYVSEKDLESVLEEIGIEDYIEEGLGANEVSEAIESKGYSLGDLGKMESLCSILSACHPSERENSFEFYKEREKAILEVQNELFDNIDTTKRLAKVYGDLGKAIQGEDYERALDLFEKKMELLEDILEDEKANNTLVKDYEEPLGYSFLDYREFTNLCEEMVSDYAKDKEMQVLKREVEWLEKVRDNFELESSEQFLLEKDTFYSVGTLGRGYLERYGKEGSESDFEKGISLKEREIKIGLGLIYGFDNLLSDEEKGDIKKRLMYATGYSARFYKQRAMEVESQNCDEEAKHLYREAEAYKERELKLLKDDLVKEVVSESKRYNYIIEGLSTLVRCRQSLGLDDTSYLKEMVEYSEKLSEDALKGDRGLLNSLEFATHLLRDKREDDEYDYDELNEKFQSMKDNF